MDKSPDAFRTISEVADWLGTPAHVLRFWESRFSQVKPVKRAGGRRYYRPSDMVLLGGIKKLLHDDGMTIRGVQKLLREHGVRYVASMSPQIEGVDPVEPPRESVGPVPAAPMAEDVPTGAFDPIPETAEERIIPFSRPNIPAQSIPNAAPEFAATPLTSPPVAPVPSEIARPDLGMETVQTQGDVPEFPMIELDAPIAPPFEHSNTIVSATPIATAEHSEAPTPNVAASHTASTNVETSEPSVAAHAMIPPADTTPPTAQVTFDFGIDAEADAEDAPEAAPIADNAAFEAALQDALATPDIDVNTGAFAPPPKVSPEIIEASVGSVQDQAIEGVFNPFEMDSNAPDAVNEPVIDVVSQTTPSISIADDALDGGSTEETTFDDTTRANDNAFVGEITSDATSVEPNVTGISVVDDIADMEFAEAAVQNGEPNLTDVTPPVEPVDDTIMVASDPQLEDVAATLEPTARPELHKIDSYEGATSESISNVPHDATQAIPAEAIPDDLEDDAMGLDVPEGVLGRLNVNALATVDPMKVQAIFDRAMALKTKLSKAG